MGIALHTYLKTMIDMGGSDLLLASGYPPAMRVYGRLESTSGAPLSSADVAALLQEITLPQEYDRLRDELSLDFSYEGDIEGVGVSRFRCNAYLQRRGLSVVLRLIPWEPPSLESLHLPSSLATQTMRRNGLILVTGPTGCGKTNTLAAMCRHINENRPVNVVMIEDPIEFVHRDKMAIIVQRQVGVHVASFQRALLSALREDPDVIVVSELRDLETIHLAMTAAETGHLVLGTLHTTSATQTISRIIGTFPAAQQWQIRAMLADCLRAVISQQLVPSADGHGCYPATELLLHSDAVANVIREDKTQQLPSMIESGSSRGMHMMDHDLLRLVEEDLVDSVEALNRAHNKQDFANRLEARRRKKGIR